MRCEKLDIIDLSHLFQKVDLDGSKDLIDQKRGLKEIFLYKERGRPFKIDG
jgi:hypothetical protein